MAAASSSVNSCTMLQSIARAKSTAVVTVIMIPVTRWSIAPTLVQTYARFTGHEAARSSQAVDVMLPWDCLNRA
jgi:hypothetical protein